MKNVRHSQAVLITGTSTGIGRATALLLDELGYTVIAGVRTDKDAEDIKKSSSANLITMHIDVTDQKSIEAAKDKIQDLLINKEMVGLINNAGIGFGAPLEFAPSDKLRMMFEVNVFGLLSTIQTFLPFLRQSKGRIINISSTASLMVSPFHGMYSATKLAVNGLSNALRLELKPHGVYVSVIICGCVRTPIWKKGFEITHDIIERNPSEAADLYGDTHNKTLEYFDKIGKSGISPEIAAKIIVKPLVSKNPKNTYYVGPDAKLYSIADRVLPAGIKDWLILHSMGLK